MMRVLAGILHRAGTGRHYGERPIRRSAPA